MKKRVVMLTLFLLFLLALVKEAVAQINTMITTDGGVIVEWKRSLWSTGIGIFANSDKTEGIERIDIYMLLFSYSIFEKGDDDELKINVNIGVQAGYVGFESRKSRGAGVIGRLAIGVRSQWKRFFLVVDVGPAVVLLQDEVTEIAIIRTEAVVSSTSFGVRIF